MLTGLNIMDTSKYGPKGPNHGISPLQPDSLAQSGKPVATGCPLAEEVPIA